MRCFPILNDAIFCLMFFQFLTMRFFNVLKNCKTSCKRCILTMFLQIIGSILGPYWVHIGSIIGLKWNGWRTRRWEPWSTRTWISKIMWETGRYIQQGSPGKSGVIYWTWLEITQITPNTRKLPGTAKRVFWKCWEDQEHLLVCDGYADLRENVDLRMEPELVDFFQRVMDRRREMKWD